MLILGEIIYKQEEVVRETHSDWGEQWERGPSPRHSGLAVSGGGKDSPRADCSWGEVID